MITTKLKAKKKCAARRPALWLGLRERGKGYELGVNPDYWDRIGGFLSGWLVSFCKKDFESVTGLKLRTGQMVKVRISIKILRERKK